LISYAPILAAFLSCALVFLAACEGPTTENAPPMRFLGAKTRLVANDLVDVTVSAARPREGAMKAYADCVGSQYALIRGMDYARRLVNGIF